MPRVTVRRPVAALVAAVAALAILGVGNAARQDPWIIFVGSPGHGTRPPQLFRVRTSGGSLSQISTGSRPAGDPSFSPAGKRLVFARFGSGLFLANVDGSRLSRLTANGNDRYPVWAPNGDSIAFLRPDRRLAARGYRLHVISADGKRQHLVLAAPAAAGRPSWEPDSKALVIPSGGAFYKVNAAIGRVEKRLAPTYDLSLGTLFWTLSPSGRTLAYVGRRPEPPGCKRAACEVFALYVQSVASSSPRRFADDAAVAGWSPGGRGLVYPHGGALNLQALAGGPAKVISVGDLALDGEAPPAWQPR
jgi:dipeptidyl aminopeptidase/acylaminoacyl peptidase